MVFVIIKENELYYHLAAFFLTVPIKSGWESRGVIRQFAKRQHFHTISIKSAPRVPYVQMLVYEENRNCCLQNIIATNTQSRSTLMGKLYPAGSLRPRLVGKLYPAIFYKYRGSRGIRFKVSNFFLECYFFKFIL